MHLDQLREDLLMMNTNLKTSARSRLQTGSLATDALAVVVFLVIGSTTSPAIAGSKAQVLSDVTTMDTGVFYTFPDTPITAISAHGNLVRFDGPVGFEHIGTGTFGEGYVLCYGSTRAYDVGYTEAGFGPPTVASCTGNNCTIVRKTTDNKIEFKQEFHKSSTAELGRNIRVKMTVKNLTATNLANVVLRRQVDFDVDTGGSKGTGSFDNWFASSQFDSAFAWNSPNDYTEDGHALMLRHLTKTPTAIKTVSKVTANILDTTCSPANIADSGPIRGDYGVTLQYNIGTIPATKSAIGIVEYQRN